MSAGVDPRDFGALEATVRHLAAKLDEEAQARVELTAQIKELNAVLQQVRGARWTLLALLGLGGAMGSAITTIATLLKQ